MLGRYELLAPIGTGGMATVILARQRGPRGFEKAVVLKVVHPHMAHEPAAIEMLLDEARVAAQISHHNVVQTYELGEARGTYFIAMEYLAGESLSHVLKAATTGAPAPSPVLGARIVADVAEGLHAAHELRGFDGSPLGVIHRDVSPSNVVVLYNGGVKVVDFGIAKANGRLTTTQSGKVKGKYGYMAPEQIRDDGIDRRADIFSLGVVLWEALALRRLFREDNIAATLQQILTAERVPPSAYRPEVPPALDAIALRALELDPARRFQNAAEMKAAIDDVIWRARCGATEIQSYMTGLFADRIAERQQILSRVAHAAPRLTRREIEVIGAAFDDTSSLQLPATAATVGVGQAHVPTARMPVHAMMMEATPVAMPPLAPFVVPPTRKSRRPAGLSWRARAVAVLGASLALAVAAAFGVRGKQTPARPEVAGAAIDAFAESPPAPTIALVEPAPLAQAPEDPVEQSDPSPSSNGAGAVLDRTGDTRKRHHRGPRVGDAKPPSAGELTARGTERFLAGDLDGAEESYRAAIAADRGHAAAHRGLGLVYQRTGRTDDAIDHLQRYLRLAPKAKDAAAIRARIAGLEGS
jgi:serine/threonine-protein kinase